MTYFHKVKGSILVSCLLALLVSCGSQKEIDARWAQDRNVAKQLTGKTVLYTIFIDSKETLPWSGFDLQSTKDTLEKVVGWVKSQGAKYGKDIEIETVYATMGKSPAIKKKLPYKSISEAFGDNGLSKGSKLSKWAEGIVKKIEKGVKLPNNEQLPKKPKLDAFHKLVEKLKKIHAADNVVIFMMVNNYFKADVSAVINTMVDEDCEFAINSGKNANLIAAQFLSLFGAQNLNAEWEGNYVVKELAIAEKDFPNDVMLNFERELYQLNVGEYTAHLVGWEKNLNTRYIDLLKIEKVKKKKK